jgi:hypothetical protein
MSCACGIPPEQHRDDWTGIVLPCAAVQPRTIALGLRCTMCWAPCDSNPGVTETGEPVCSESCYRAWIAHLEAGR